MMTRAPMRAMACMVASVSSGMSDRTMTFEHVPVGMW